MASSETRLCRSAWAKAGHERGADPAGGEDAEDHGHRQQDQGHDAGGPHGVPERGGGRWPASAATSPARGPRSGGRRTGASRRTSTTAPSPPTSRAGTPVPSRLPRASSPQTTAAVLQALASTQVGAATDTSDHTGGAASPVHGSTMWCTRRPLRSQVRAVVPEVARPPSAMATTWSTWAGGGVALGGDARWPNRPRDGSGNGHVAAQVHQHATAERLGDPVGGPVGGEGLGGGPEVDVDADRDGDGPAARVEPDPPPAGCRSGVGPGRSGRRPIELVEVAVVAQLDQGRADGRIDDAGGVLTATPQATSRTSNSRGLTGTGRPGAVTLRPSQLRIGAEPAAGPVEGAEVDRPAAPGPGRPRSRVRHGHRWPWCRWPASSA